MARVITFSREFPSYHPRAGQSTFFVEKFHYSIFNQVDDKWATMQDCILDLNKHLPKKLVRDFIDSLDTETYFNEIEKHHTIRIGHRFKADDWFSPRVWSGKPYNSKQIIIAPDIQITKTWDIEIDPCDVWAIALPGQQLKYTDENQDALIARNDGLTEQDLYFWFKAAKKPFDGQIICWNEKIEY